MTAAESKDISLAITAFYLKYVGFWVADNRVEQRRRNIALGYTIWMLLFSTVILLPELYFTWGDLSVSVRLISYWIPLIANEIAS